MTAASCVDGINNQGIPKYVRVGPTTYQGGSAIQVTPGSLYIHPEFNPGDQQSPNIALFRLEGVLGYVNGAVELNPLQNVPDVGNQLFVAGFGYTSTSGGYPSNLQQAFLPYLSDCKPAYDQFDFARTICANGKFRFEQRNQKKT